MGILISCQSLTKSYRSRPLFSDISFGIEDGEKLGLIGPNGAGKSTLLKILSGIVSPDSGSVVSRKRLRVAYVPQDENFPEDESVDTIVRQYAAKSPFEDYEQEAAIDSVLSKIGFVDREVLTHSLSGGWRKRLALACALVQQPELLLMDEPTNHLDLEGVLWLENLLKSSRLAYVVISHDRAFLENITSRIIELNPTYPQGVLSVKGNYSQFLMAREEQLSAQANLQQALASQVRREVAWLARGARARQTKSRERIAEAGKLMDNLADVKTRNSMNTAIEIGFDASGRKAKELISVKQLKKGFSGKTLIKDLSFVLSNGTKLGLVGRNGSGKSTLLKLLVGSIEPDSGTVKRANDLKIVLFDQNREQLDQSKTLKQSLSSESDSVVYRGRSMHITTWAKKFLFQPDQLDLPISYLSGGEQARILIANLMLLSADILILDEPTNDLDIPSLEVLEESLLDFPGAVILVSHDRMLLDEVSNHILALDGNGVCEFFADYSQCEKMFQRFASVDDENGGKNKSEKSGKTQSRVKETSGKSANSTALKRELGTLMEKIEKTEAKIESLQLQMSDTAIATNYVKLAELAADRDKATTELEQYFARWAELEAQG
ncbi:MAG: ABC-F family ATP-binding cassette domain-containing protein [Candidatus Obscuribacterales bacterium]|nr:ABC-F family ATP-binding cassette domain-containing protein [Candidatus Obscuribacterales bacterium]